MKEVDSLIEYGRPRLPAKSSPLRWVARLAFGLVVLILGLLYWASPVIKEYTAPVSFKHLRTHCRHTQPIGPGEFLLRQERLAKTLDSLDAAAYIAEPGSDAFYFANISKTVWHPSERPLLLVVTPERTATGLIKSHITILTPHFEARRASLLHIPVSNSTSGVTFIEWAEAEDPYTVLVQSLAKGSFNGTQPVFVDENMRHFVVKGLAKAGLRVEAVSDEVRRLREQKSDAEIALLTCANEVTLLAIRAVRSHMYIGMKESEGQTLIRAALSAAGLTNLDSLVLFGESAALPHGSGANRALGLHDLALFDVGGQLHGYTSDITRTIALPSSRIPSARLELWYIVQAAQRAALAAARVGVKARAVDEAARAVIDATGNGEYFTHRLGHGIGLDGHESPYLRGGNEVVLAANNTFSNEPGIYIVEDVGVRLEDCFVVVDGLGDQTTILFTQGVGGFARSPWKP